MNVKNIKILDPKNLPYFGALVQAVLFSIAGNQFFPVLGWLAGLGVGMVVNYSIALASSRVNDVAEKRKPMAKTMLYLMLVISPATITLSLFKPASVFTAIAWAVCVDFSIVLAGAIAGKSLIPQSEPKSKTATRSGRGSDRSAKKSGRSKPHSIVVAEIACRYAPQCSRTFTSQNAENAHAGRCGFKPLATLLTSVEQKVEKPA